MMLLYRYSDIMPIFSVIILSKNNGDTLENCIKSIIDSKCPKGWEREIIVVDAHSTDNTPRVLKKYNKYIKVVYDEGRGIGIARNIGISNARGDIICFVDADCIIGKKHFIKIIEAIKNGADIVDVKGQPIIREISNLSKIARLELMLWNIGRAYSKKLRENRCFAGGSFMALKREVFKKTGKFWENVPYGADDMDFSFRAYRKGFKITVVDVKGSFAIPRSSLRKLIKQQIGWGAGYAFFITKYRKNMETWKCYRFNRLIYRFFGSYVWLYLILRFMLAPLGGVKLFIKTKELLIIPYWIIRRYAFLYGVLKSLFQIFLKKWVQES